MLGVLRGTAFSFVGGFSVTTLFTDALVGASATLQQNLNNLNNSMGYDSGEGWMDKKNNGGGGSSSSRGGGGWFAFLHPRNNKVKAHDPADNSLVEDIEMTIRKHQLLALSFLIFCITGGGFGAVAGSITAVAFDGEEGLDRYYMVKDRVLDAYDVEREKWRP